MPDTLEFFKNIEKGQLSSFPPLNNPKSSGTKQPKGKHAFTCPVYNVELVTLEPLWYNLMEQ